MTAASLDVLTGGRFRLGLGVSGPQVSEGWHGVRFAQPLVRAREYLTVVDAATIPRIGDARIGLADDALQQVLQQSYLAFVERG